MTARRLPYRGRWLWLGPDMLHLMELPNPDSDCVEFRPPHGGKDRHVCLGVRDIQPLIATLEANNVPFTMSRSGRPALFFRDPDANTIEAVETEPWR